MKYILIIILVLISVGVWVFPKAKEQEQVTGKVAEPSPVTLVLVGDIMFDRGVRRKIEGTYKNDYSKLFEHTSYLKDADIAFGNLEGPVATSGYKVGSRFSFRMNPDGLLAMKGAGFDVVSFANNHVGDYTLAAFNETIANLHNVSIIPVGAGTYDVARTVQVKTVRGLDIGFLAFSDVGPEWMKATQTRSGILLANDPNLVEIIRSAKELVDVLVVSFHWGDEYSPANAREEKLATSAIDAGADIIVGHHPHVMQRVDFYKDKPIFYSLGNFIFDQYFSPHTLRGMVGFVSIDPETKAISVETRVSVQNTDFIPQPLVPFEETMLVTKRFVP